MAISWIANATATSAANTDVSITIPTGSMAVNDLMIVCYAIGDNDSVDQNVAMVGGSWSEVTDLFGNSAGTQDVSLGVYYEYWDGVDTTAVGDALAAGTDAAVAGCMMVFRGVATVAQGGPFFDTPSATTGTGQDFDPIANTNDIGDWIVIAGGAGDLTGGTGATANQYTMPTGYTTNPTGASFGDTSDVSVGMAYTASAAGADENPGIATHAGANDTTNYNWAACTMVLVVAPAASTAFDGIMMARTRV